MKKRLVLTATTIGAMALTASASTTADTLNLQEVTVTAINKAPTYATLPFRQQKSDVPTWSAMA